ncbi:MAG: hypothetical protein K9L28_02265, partial [Synergistales bacterium]|nr:hypothetical protein [Synergistales bacterium]
PLLGRERVAIGSEETAGGMLEDLARKGGKILTDVLQLLQNSEVDERPQDHQEATCAPKISKDEACIRWDAGGDAVHNLVRALHPSPGAYALLAEKRVKIWKTQPVRHALPAGSLQPDSDGYPLVGCGTDAVRLLSVQPQGKKPQDARDWFNGLQGKKGLWFSCSHRNDARH